MSNKSRMYEGNGTRVKTWNPFVGCKFNCKYCYAPEIYKRFSKCEQCKAFTPHFHPERLQQKFKAGETVFVCSMGDISFVSTEQYTAILDVIENNPKTTFYIQSKNPGCFFLFERFLDNVVWGTTLETNKSDAGYFRFTKASVPIFRLIPLQCIKQRKYITMEPVFEFDLDKMVEYTKEIAPEFVYVGYLNPEWKAKKLQLPEPLLEKTEELVNELKKFTEVRLKTMRKAWNEKINPCTQ